jgi:hypothetical protein
MSAQASARVMRSAFISYRQNLELARDPDESANFRSAAWSRAAKARSRLEQQIALIECQSARGKKA